MADNPQASAGNNSPRLDPKVIKLTRESLGQFVKRPPLTEKLLSRPPFRFLQDIVAAVISTTGFMAGLFTEAELNTESVKDRDAKIAFLQKAVSMVSLVTGRSIRMKPAKTVAGQEAEKTNEFLQALADAIARGVDNDEYVRKVLDGETAGKSSPRINKLTKHPKAGESPKSDLPDVDVKISKDESPSHSAKLQASEPRSGKKIFVKPDEGDVKTNTAKVGGSRVKVDRKETNDNNEDARKESSVDDRGKSEHGTSENQAVVGKKDSVVREGGDGKESEALRRESSVDTADGRREKLAKLKSRLEKRESTGSERLSTEVQSAPSKAEKGSVERVGSKSGSSDKRNESPSKIRDQAQAGKRQSGKDLSSTSVGKAGGGSAEKRSVVSGDSQKGVGIEKRQESRVSTDTGSTDRRGDSKERTEKKQVDATKRSSSKDKTTEDSGDGAAVHASGVKLNDRVGDVEQKGQNNSRIESRTGKAGSSRNLNESRAGKTAGSPDRREQRIGKAAGSPDLHESQSKKVSGLSDRHESRTEKVAGSSTRQESRKEKVAGSSEHIQHQHEKVAGSSDSHESRKENVAGSSDDHKSRTEKVAGSSDRHESRVEKVAGSSDRHESRNEKISGSSESHQSRTRKAASSSDHVEPQTKKAAGSSDDRQHGNTTKEDTASSNNLHREQTNLPTETKVRDETPTKSSGNLTDKKPSKDGEQKRTADDNRRKHREQEPEDARSERRSRREHAKNEKQVPRSDKPHQSGTFLTRAELDETSPGNDSSGDDRPRSPTPLQKLQGNRETGGSLMIHEETKKQQERALENCQLGGVQSVRVPIEPITGCRNISCKGDDEENDNEDIEYLVREACFPANSALQIFGSEDPSESSEHGGLVKKLLRAKRDHDELAATNRKKVEIDRSQMGVDVEKNRRHEMLMQDIGKLRAKIQSFTGNINPLAKILDFLQEDLDSMRKEMKQWQKETRSNAEAIEEEQRLAESAIEPLKTQLADIEKEIVKQEQANATIKAQSLQNQERIKKLINLVALINK